MNHKLVPRRAIYELFTALDQIFICREKQVRIWSKCWRV